MCFNVYFDKTAFFKSRQKVNRNAYFWRCFVFVIWKRCTERQDWHSRVSAEILHQLSKLEDSGKSVKIFAILDFKAGSGKKRPSKLIITSNGNPKVRKSSINSRVKYFNFMCAEWAADVFSDRKLIRDHWKRGAKKCFWTIITARLINWTQFVISLIFWGGVAVRRQQWLVQSLQAFQVKIVPSRMRKDYGAETKPSFSQIPFWLVQDKCCCNSSPINLVSFAGRFNPGIPWRRRIGIKTVIIGKNFDSRVAIWTPPFLYRFELGFNLVNRDHLVNESKVKYHAERGSGVEWPADQPSRTHFIWFTKGRNQEKERGFWGCFFSFVKGNGLPFGLVISRNWA